MIDSAEGRAANLAYVLSEYVRGSFATADSAIRQLALASQRIGGVEGPAAEWKPLLETTRVWECLSLGKLVVSERSTDMEDHGELDGLVDFVDIDDIAGMVGRVRYWLGHPSDREERVRSNQAAIAGGFNRFDYFFHRFLIATDNISFDQFWREAGRRYPLESDRLCLNLPEYTDRGRDFARDNHYGFSLFPGLRHGCGWLGHGAIIGYRRGCPRRHGGPTPANGGRPR